MDLTKNIAKKILKSVMMAMGVKVPNVRFTSDRGRKKINLSDNTEIVFSFDQGIVVIENWDGFKNEKKVAEVMKKMFGDVSVQPGYINARDYGKKYKEVWKLTNPKNIKELPKFKSSDFKGLTTKTVQSKIIKPIDNAIKNRKVKIDQKNVRKKFPVLYKGKEYSSFSVVEYENEYYVLDSFNLHYVKSLEEGVQLVKLMEIRMEIISRLMQRSWSADTLGPANALD